MTLRDVLEKIDDFTEEERERYLLKVLDLFSPVGKATMLHFQEDWDPDKGFAAFVKEQNKTFKMCIELECCPAGNYVREVMKLAPLTLETELI